MSDIPLEARAQVIFSYDRNLINGLKDIPSDTEKVYYRGLALKSPAWLNPKDAAERLASAEDSDIVERLELDRISVFTKDLEDAMRFHHGEINEALRRLQLQVKAKIIAKSLDEEYFPF